MAARHPPTRSNHARDRFAERDRSPDEWPLDCWTAWVDAEPIRLPARYRTGDEARYHHEAQVVLCRREDVLTTVYDVVGPDSDPAVRRAVERQCDVELPEKQQ